MTRTENTDKNLADNGIDSLSDPLNRGETPEMAETLKKEDVAKVIAKDSKTNPHTKVLMFSFLNNSNKQWETILGTTE